MLQFIRTSIIFSITLITLTVSGECGTYLVKTIKEYEQVSAKLLPGDSIILARGNWENFNIVFKGKGTNDRPILLTAEASGEVFITGNSSLSLAGEHLLIKGLVFKNGYSPKEAVISFKVSDKEYASHSRVTECVVDGFNKPNRWEQDNYVAIWGRNNRFDHCYLGNKTNLGVTLVIYIKGEEHQKNYHSVDNNYFGPRPRLGSNGGETIRVGVSDTSPFSTFAKIENNWFEHCNGEAEIVSIKSSDNTIRGNVFYECEGSLVLRHGDRNIVAENIFLGNFKPFTGGVRIVNEGHKIYNNYFLGLTGEGFRAPLVLMKGFENSPLNRYKQVKNVDIVGNAWIDCYSPWQLGMDFNKKPGEQDFVMPEKVRIAYNVIYHSLPKEAEIIKSDTKGVELKSNFINLQSENKLLGEVVMEKNDESFHPTVRIDFGKLKNLSSEFHNLYQNKKFIDFPAFENLPKPNAKSKKGPNWYVPAHLNEETRCVMNNVVVSPGSKSFMGVLARLPNEGKVVLLSGQDYELSNEIVLEKNIEIEGAPFNKNKPTIKASSFFQGETLIKIKDKGALRLDNVKLRGNGVKYAITSDKGNMRQSYSIRITNSLFENFSSPEAGSAIIKGFNNTFADTLFIDNTEFRNSGECIVFDDEKEDNGVYNIENIILKNSVFSNILGPVMSVHRHGIDESTLGPFLTIDGCKFTNITCNADRPLLNPIGVQYITIQNSFFADNACKTIIDLKKAAIDVANNEIKNSGEIINIKP